MLKYAASFSFDILPFIAVCSLLVIDTLSKLQGELFGKKCESASDKLHSALYTLTVAGMSHITWISGILLRQFCSSANIVFFTL